jgi:FMN phosphatase YigB (HAD superfamily)
VPIGCLSNTNTMHWEHQTTLWPMLDMFDFRFLSFELGFAKPDQAIFRAVADRLPFSRDRILYLDDVAVNSEAARSFGFQSRQVLGIDEVKRELSEVGVLAT